MRAGMTAPAHGSLLKVPVGELRWLPGGDILPCVCLVVGGCLSGASPATSHALFSSVVPRVVKFTSGLSAMVAEEGQEATFQCVVSPSDAGVTWYKDGMQLQPSEKFVMVESGASRSLTILGLTLEDAGQVTVEAEGASSSAALRVRGKLGTAQTFRMSSGSCHRCPSLFMS